MSNIMKYSPVEIIDQLLSSVSARNERKCSSLSDRIFFREGVTRALSKATTGREFLQDARDLRNLFIPRQTFFDAMHSSRRLNVVHEFALQIEGLADWFAGDKRPDQLAAFQELDGWNVYAVDGHCIEHASHAPRSENNTFIPAGTLFKTDLRNGLTSVLGPQPQTQKGRQHEMKVFKSLVSTSLSKTLFVNDRAYIDNFYWLEAAYRNGIRMVSRIKDNMIPLMKVPIAFDADDKINTGITGVYHISFNNTAGFMRLVEYTDPETGRPYSFITTMEETVRPGVIAWLYKLRWNIEKVFDVFKNLLFEKKAWASSKISRHIMAAFIATAYNFARIIQWLLGHMGINEEKLLHKRKTVLARRRIEARQKGRQIHPLEYTSCRIYRISAQFIRALRNCFRAQKSIIAFKDNFISAMMAYI